MPHCGEAAGRRQDRSLADSQDALTASRVRPPQAGHEALGVEVLRRGLPGAGGIPALRRQGQPPALPFGRQRRGACQGLGTHRTGTATAIGTRITSAAAAIAAGRHQHHGAAGKCSAARSRSNRRAAQPP